MFLMIDHFDSFVYNLTAYLSEAGCDVRVMRSDAIDRKKIENWYQAGKLEGIILSPGPGNPRQCQETAELVSQMLGKTPILGVCLGHQILGHMFGASVERGKKPMHGKVTAIRHNKKGLFRHLPSRYRVTRYHSLEVVKQTIPEEISVDAVAEDGSVMGFHHREYPVYGVQFHPEAVLTEYGHELLETFVEICMDGK